MRLARLLSWSKHVDDLGLGLRVDATLDRAAPDAADVPGQDVAADTPSTPDAPVDASPPDAGPAPLVYRADLTGRQEVPVVYGTSATGAATFTLNADRTSLTYMVTHTLLTPTGAHIHVGMAGEAGAVLVPLTSAPALIAGTTAVTPEQVLAIEEGRAYVNIHSAAFPGGELRGQILRPGEVLYLGRLTGAEEVPPVTTTASGNVAVILNTNRNGVVYDGDTMNITPTMAHLHQAPLGMNGAVVLPLTLTGSTMRGTVMLPNTMFADELASGNIYANVHSATNPGGEIRGQMRRLPSAP